MRGAFEFIILSGWGESTSQSRTRLRLTRVQRMPVSGFRLNFGGAAECQPCPILPSDRTAAVKKGAAAEERARRLRSEL